jgi:hypothetical protein
MPVSGSLGIAQLTHLDPKVRQAVLTRLSLCDSVFQKRTADQAAYLARTLETRRHRVHGDRSLCASVTLCFEKEPQIKQPILRGLWKHGDTESTEVDLSVSL